MSFEKFEGIEVLHEGSYSCFELEELLKGEERRFCLLKIQHHDVE